MAPTAEQLRHARERRGLSREQLADATGVSASTIQRIELGETTRSRYIAVLVDALAPELAVIAPGAASARSVAEATDLELLTELLQRAARRDSGLDPSTDPDSTNPNPDPNPRVLQRWSTGDAPSGDSERRERDHRPGQDRQAGR